MKIYSAKWILPMDGPPIENGEIVVDGGLIVEVRPIQTPSNERRDLGNAVLLPGLINAHTHLEYTALRGFLEDIPFFPWIRSLNSAKVHLTAEDWVVSAKMGALECLANGITTIGDNTDSGASLDAAVWSGLRGRIYQEFFCIDHRTDPYQVADDLVRKLTILSNRRGDRLTVGISPHATYTINQPMFEVLRNDIRLSSLPSSIHIAESSAEQQLIKDGTGPFAEMFERRSINWSPPRVSPTQYVFDQGALKETTLLIHGVHQSLPDIALTRQSGASIIHCPKSNAKLGAGVAPLTEWLKIEGLKLGIGTDSAVSNNSLDIFEEMRFGLLMQRGKREMVEEVTAGQMLALATIRGAQAMGLDKTVGTLRPGLKADIIAVNLSALPLLPARSPINTLVYSASGRDVKLTIIDGQVCYDDGRFIDIDTEVLREQAIALERKLSLVGN